MAITYQLPKSARFYQTSNRFTGVFNAPSLGVYDFNNANNTGQVVIPLEPNAIFFVDRINVGGTIPEEEYLFAVSTFPTAILRFLVENPRVYPLPLPIVNYIDNQESCAWVWSDKGGDSLLLDFRGVLAQTPFLVGVAEISVAISFNIYRVTDSNFVRAFRDTDSTGAGVGLSTRPLPGPGTFEIEKQFSRRS